MEIFGETPDGGPVYRLTLTGGGLTVRLLTWGAVLQDLRLDGHAAPLVLGFDSFAPYLTHSPHFGATAGRCANRIRDGRFTLDGQEFQLDRNTPFGHSLHGGAVGMGKRLWQVAGHGEGWAELAIELADGDMGFPGRLRARARFSLAPGGVLDIHYSAESDRATLCNLAHHSYFALDDSGSILDHRLRLAADAFLPTDEGLIPTGEQRPIAGTPYDLRAGASIREANAGGAMDCNFCLGPARTALREVGRLESPASGIAMAIRTTEPGLQVYDCARVDIPLPGLDGRRYGAFAGLALEPQVWPDAIHHPDWAQPVLRPGETYRQHTQFAFTRGAA